MARPRPRSRAPIEDPDEDFQEESVYVDDVKRAMPRKSSTPWVLLGIVMVFVIAAGYFGFTTLMAQKNTIEELKKDRDEALADITKLEAENAGLRAARDTLERRVSELEAEVKEKDARLTQDPQEELAAPTRSKKKKASSTKTSRTKRKRSRF